MTVLERSTPGIRRTKLRGVLQASCCLKRSDCCLPPTPVYFLEDSRRFYELLPPVLLLLSLTVLQLSGDISEGSHGQRDFKRTDFGQSSPLSDNVIEGDSAMLFMNGSTGIMIR
ncbi:hypothetical protein LAZ67_17000306 [Cordylochernes scorpioides]|uniref:Uncharacterized protein n=1 Tax=Cordylochernes scorpioides TaxID=51811 RepID=A0ABY6LCN1_9ARAC|nr:hypothetical protein LAZ67_17000306 [Cordylochernes scorpioides]